MTPNERIAQHFKDSQNTLELAYDTLNQSLLRAAEMLANSLDAGGKLLICGNGGSASDALHFSSELLNKMDMERPPLAAVCLNSDVSTITSIGNDYSYDEIFSKQVQALAREHDVLIAFTTSGNSKNILRAQAAAQNAGIQTLALTGKDGGLLAPQLDTDHDIELRVPSTDTARIQEVHGLMIHCLCDHIDHQLF